MNTVHYTHCPVCNSSAINPLLTVKDHSVSKQDFVIWLCSSCQLRFTQNVPDEHSIAAYYRSEDYISHTNTSKGFINKLYQKVRTYTLNQKAKLVSSYTKEKGNILDLGAGVGAFLATMQAKGWEVTGIEPDSGARAQAKNDFHIGLKDKNEFLNLQQGSFDAITYGMYWNMCMNCIRTWNRSKNCSNMMGNCSLQCPIIRLPTILYIKFSGRLMTYPATFIILRQHQLRP